MKKGSITTKVRKPKHERPEAGVTNRLAPAKPGEWVRFRKNATEKWKIGQYVRMHLLRNYWCIIKTDDGKYNQVPMDSEKVMRLPVQPPGGA